MRNVEMNPDIPFETRRALRLLEEIMNAGKKIEENTKLLQQLGVFKEKVAVTTASRSPTWALGAVYVSEEEFARLTNEEKMG